MASTVDTVTGSNRTRTPLQRKVFYAAGRFWAFYSNGTNVGFRTSPDGAAWSAFTALGGGSAGAQISVCFDGTYLHYSRTAGASIYYRRGIPNADGTVTWSAAEQLVHNVLLPQDPSVAVDSNGFPWVAYSWTSGPKFWRVKNSSTNDGTWVTDNTWDLASSVSYSVLGALVALTNGRMYTAYFTKAPGGSLVRGKLYDGVAWGAQENASVSVVDTTDFSQASITAIADDVHLVFLERTSFDIIYRRRTFGVGWGAEEVIQAATTVDSAPVISYHVSTGDLYCFWQQSPAADHVYYSVRDGVGWGAPVDWIDESVDGLEDRSTLTCSLQSYSGYINVLYISAVADPWNVRHDHLNLGNGGVGADEMMAAAGIGGGGLGAQQPYIEPVEIVSY